MSQKGEARAKCNELLRGMLIDWMESHPKASYNDLARMSGLSNCYLHRMKHGLYRGFSFVTAIRLLDFFGVSLSEFEKRMRETP